MKKFNTLLVSAILILSLPAMAQLKEFEVTPVPAQVSIPIFPNNPDDAAIIFYSLLPDLDFESTTGGIVDIKGNPDEGKYIVIVKTEKQIITVKMKGYIESKLRLSRLKAKDVRYYSIESREIEHKGKFILTTNPSGALLEIDDLSINDVVTPFESGEITAGDYNVKLRKNNYEPLDTTINIVSGETSIKMFELKPIALQEAIRFEINKNVLLGSNLLKNVYYEIIEGELFLYYDLVGEADEDYEVKLVLKNSRDKSYELIPEQTFGRIGEGKFNGLQNRIIWNCTEDLPKGLIGSSYFLELTAEEVSSSGWLYYVGGGIVAAVIAAVLGGSGEDSESSTDTGIAGPPDRP